MSIKYKLFRKGVYNSGKLYSNKMKDYNFQEYTGRI